MTARRDDGLVVGDRYYVLASSVAADLPKLVLKHDDAFLVADRRGDFPAMPGTEFGFYTDGTRFLHQLEFRVHDRHLLFLNATVSDDGLEAAIDLTNPDIVGAEPTLGAAERERLILPGRAFRIRRLLTVYRDRLYHTVSIENFALEPYSLDLGWYFGADFVDLFEVRGYRRDGRGQHLPGRTDGTSVTLAYRGLDAVVRAARLEFDPAPGRIDAGSALYTVSMAPGQRLDFALTITATVGDVEPQRSVGGRAALTERRSSAERLRGEATHVETDHRLFNGWMQRARGDLHLLLTQTPVGLIPYAGIPWYVAPFGRDSLITALQVLPFEPDIARGTLAFLAGHQANVDDAFTDASPGKILHEYRRGELAACRETPFIPYYGSVDATPLFLILLGEYLRWSGDVEFARRLWPAAERALAWMLGRPGDGYLRYQCRSPVGLAHQGWKDSHDAIMHTTGEPAKPPIALVEAQGYQFAALLAAAGVADTLGHAETARRAQERAASARERFEAEFWMEDEGFYALALDGDGRPCRVISSNPGHCLWSGIVRHPRAEMVARRLMGEEMFTGWGIRTLSVRARVYNPMSYHNGSVWPHDTALAAVGMARYRLVESFMVLGFEADASQNRLTLNDPRLPPWLGWLEIRGLRLSKSRLDLRIAQGREGAAVELLARAGDAEVVVRR
jgi:glycogen debranching enzyme